MARLCLFWLSGPACLSRFVGRKICMTKLRIPLVFGLLVSICTAQSSDKQTNSTANVLPPSWVDDRTEVTCRAAYYRRFNDDVLFPVAEARRAEKLMVSGVVLTVVAPREFAGQVVAFHFDYGSEPWDHWYKPDVLYAGKVPRSWIGRLAFMCDPGWHAATNQVPAEPSKQGGTNQRQPFRSETNRASPAAASRRSP